MFLFANQQMLKTTHLPGGQKICKSNFMKPIQHAGMTLFVCSEQSIYSFCLSKFCMCHNTILVFETVQIQTIVITTSTLVPAYTAWMTQACTL